MLYSEIIPLLEEQRIIGASGKISFNLLGINVNVSTKDIVGGLLQDWFGSWMRENDIGWKTGPHAQSWPDFILEDGSDLEFKAFDRFGGPNFDLANFDAFTRSLLMFPERLDTDHLVFEYSLDDGIIKITNFWVKKIWEMTGPSEKNILNLQVKQGIPTNIRPKNWRSSNSRVEFFRNRYEFVVALDKALQRFYPSRYPIWISTLEDKYYERTGFRL